MRSGNCPKCGSDEIYKRERKSGINRIVINWRTASHPYIYICARCGFYEYYLEDKKHLQKLKSSSRWKLFGRKNKRKNDNE